MMQTARGITPRAADCGESRNQRSPNVAPIWRNHFKERSQCVRIFIKIGAKNTRFEGRVVRSTVDGRLRVSTVSTVIALRFARRIAFRRRKEVDDDAWR